MNQYALDALDDRRKSILSNSITFLKFPLAILVVILHVDISTKPIENIGLNNLELTEPLYMQVSWLFSRYLAYAAVPAFFIISGFLLFYNVHEYNKDIYLRKVRSRVKSLLIPYISWNLLYLLLYWLIGHENILFAEGKNIFDESYTNLNFFIALFVKPLDGPLWFIRNLFVLVLISPVLYHIIKRSWYCLPFSLLLLTQFVHNSLIETFLWFSFGLSFSIHRFDFLCFCRKYLAVSLMIVFVTVALDYMLYPYLQTHISKHSSVFKIMAVFGIGYWCVQKYNNISQHKVLNESSFTLYAYHGIAVLGLTPVVYKYLWNNTGGAIFGYVINIIIIIILGVALSVIINRIPILRKIFCGR